MGTKNNPGDYDCYANALPDEPMFILLGRDPDAPELVEAWAWRRHDAILCGERPESDQAMIFEARECANKMRRWRAENDGKWRKPKTGGPDMDTPKTLAARLRVAARRPGQDNPICIVTVADAKAAADYLDRPSAPDVGVGLTRYSFDSTTFMGHASAVMGEDPNGEWVRFEDVAPLLAAARAVPADVVLETTAEERRAWSRLEQAIAARCSRDIDTLTAALAAIYMGDCRRAAALTPDAGTARSEDGEGE